MVLYINPTNHAPWVKNCPAEGVISSHRLTMGKKIKKNLLLRNHKAQSFHILSGAMYSVPLYKSCQPCPWGPYGACPGGVMGKTFKNLLLHNHKAQSLYFVFKQCIVVLFINPANCAPGVHTGPAPGASQEKHKKSSQKPYGPELSYVVWTNV